MFGRHRVGISVGLIFTILIGGVFGFLVGNAKPDGVFGLSGTSAGLATGFVTAAIAGIAWSVGEAIVGLAGAVGKDATLLRLALSVGGSFFSLVTAGLNDFGIHIFNNTPNPYSIFTYVPIATGLGAVALGAHALLHQLRLDREGYR